MFISFAVKNGKITIIDSDFIETISKASLWNAIVEIYEKRNLNVAANLVLASIYCGKQFYQPTVYYIGVIKKHIVIYKKYEKDIEKYWH
jgi:hypothetical protein